MTKVLGLDVSTKCIGIALFEDEGELGNLKLLTHISPTVKPKPTDKLEELILKVIVFEKEFLSNYRDSGIERVVVEEPLLRSNNVRTVGTLLRFNGMICKSVYDMLGVVPEFISSYDARKFAFPDLMGIRTANKKGEDIPPKRRKHPVLFGGHPYEVDKKLVIWEKVADKEPQIQWFYDKKNRLSKQNFDMTDAYAAVMGHMKKENHWV